MVDDLSKDAIRGNRVRAGPLKRRPRAPSVDAGPFQRCDGRRQGLPLLKRQATAQSISGTYITRLAVTILPRLQRKERSATGERGTRKVKHPKGHNVPRRRIEGKSSLLVSAIVRRLPEMLPEILRDKPGQAGSDAVRTRKTVRQLIATEATGRYAHDS